MSTLINHCLEIIIVEVVVVVTQAEKQRLMTAGTGGESSRV